MKPRYSCSRYALLRPIYALIFLASLTSTTNANAVQRSPNGHGQALVFPYFNVLKGNNTLITLSTFANSPKALKVHLRDNMGELAFSFNLYLESHGTWAGALTLREGETTLVSDDSTCLLVEDKSDGFEALSGIHSGFIEVIEMGELQPDSPFATAANNRDCAFLENSWSDGAWSEDQDAGLSPPRSGISGSAAIVNVERGTQYGIAAVALEGFSTIVQHTPASEMSPDLTSAHDEGTDGGRTASTLCEYGSCQTLFWGDPAEAVAHALLARRLSADFTTEAAINAQAEVVFTYPLQRYFESERSDDAYSSPILELAVYDREGSPIPNGERCVPRLPGSSPASVPYTIDVERKVLTLAFGNTAEDFLQVAETAVLGESSRSFFPSPTFPDLPESGRANFYTALCFQNWPQPLDGKMHPGGWPVLATLFIEFANGQLTNSEGQLIRANYGAASELKTTVN